MIKSIYYTVTTQTKRQKEKCIEGSIIEFKAFNNALAFAIDNSMHETMHDVIIEGYDYSGDRIYLARVKNAELINLIGASI